MPFPGGGPQEVGMEAPPLSPGVLPVARGDFYADLTGDRTSP